MYAIGFRTKGRDIVFGEHIHGLSVGTEYDALLHYFIQRRVDDDSDRSPGTDRIDYQWAAMSPTIRVFSGNSKDVGV